jgi:hypothetical protein
MSSHSPSLGKRKKADAAFLGIDPFLKTPDEDPAWLANLAHKLAPRMQITSRQLERADETTRITYGLFAAITTKNATDAVFRGWLTVTLGAEDGLSSTGEKKSWKKQRREQPAGRA